MYQYVGRENTKVTRLDRVEEKVIDQTVRRGRQA